MSVYGKDWDACHAEVIKLQDQVRRGLPIATTTTTVRDYLEYWLYEVAEPAIRRTTFATYEGAVRLHIVPGIGKRKLKSLQAPHIRTWLNGVSEICQCCAQGKDAKRATSPRQTARCCAKDRPSVARTIFRQARSDTCCGCYGRHYRMPSTRT